MSRKDSSSRNKIFQETNNPSNTDEPISKPPPGVQTVDIARDEFGWDIPVEAVPVPSKGMVYPPNSSLHRKETIDIRAMTAREEDILTSQALIRKGTVVATLLQSVVIDQNIDVGDMLLGDRNALMLATRVTGYGPKYDVEVKCPGCSLRQPYQFDLAQIPIKRLKLEPVQQGLNLFEYVLPVTKRTIQFKFLTGSEEEELTEANNRRRSLMPDVEVTALVTSRLESQVVSIDGVTDRTKLSAFIRKMPAYDSRKLRGYISKNEPGMEMSQEMQCRSCTKTSKIDIPIGISFFWPEL